MDKWWRISRNREGRWEISRRQIIRKESMKIKLRHEEEITIEELKKAIKKVNYEKSSHSSYMRNNKCDYLLHMFMYKANK